MVKPVEPAYPFLLRRRRLAGHVGDGARRHYCTGGSRHYRWLRYFDMYTLGVPQIAAEFHAAGGV